jgi:cell wall-associated NlpC family hydrolase
MSAITARMQLVDFVGIRYEPLGRTREALDCWGLCLLAARELYEIELPEFFYSAEELLVDAFDLIAEQTAQASRWAQIAPAGDCRAAPLGSVHIFRVKGYETHCGLCVGPGEFLHSLAGRDSCVEPLRFWSHRLTGTYQWLKSGN